MTKSPVERQEYSFLDYQLLFEATPAPYLILKPDLVICAVNAAYLQATLRRREDLVGTHLFDAFPDNPDDPHASGVANLGASLARVLKFRRADTMPVQKYDIPRPAESGGGFEERYWSPVNTPVFDRNGDLALIVHRVEDVTDLVKIKEQSAEQNRTEQALRSRTEELETEMFLRAKELHQLNQQLREANDALAELDRMKTNFFNQVSHEFRTPLTLILGPIDELLQASTNLNDTQRDQLAMVRRNAERLRKLVNSLLDFARFESGRVQASFEETDLAALTCEVASVFRSVIESANLHFIVNCPTLTEGIFVDRGMWEKIVLNLLSNAFKFTFEGEIEVRLTQGPEQVELVVRDTGCGIPQGEQAHIFQRFHQVKEQRSRTQEGSGIGLAMVSEMVKLHGGRIHVDSAPTQGACFTVTLPLGCEHLPSEHCRCDLSERLSVGYARAYVQETLGWRKDLDDIRPDATAPPPESEYVPEQFAGKSLAQILLVDDNTDMRGYIARLLSKHYAVKVVSNGREALQVIDKKLPDLLIADIMMPLMDGFELLRVIRGKPQAVTLPVVLLSGRAGEEAKAEGMESGADDYLVKPFSARELLARVAALLARKQLVEQERAFRMQAEQNRIQLERVLETVNEAFIAIDQHWRIRYLNGKAADCLGKAQSDLVGTALSTVMPAEQFSALKIELRTSQSKGIATQQELFRTGEQRWFIQQVFPYSDGWVITYTDITQRKAAELEICHLAQHDTLTELPNRLLIYEFAQRLLAHSQRTNEAVALLYIDLDHFKPINDTYGHEVGDGVLKAVSARLLSVTRQQDLVGRLGGDEFIAVLSNLRHPEDAAFVAKHILFALARPIEIGDLLLKVSSSIGISLYPRDGHHFDLLLKKADAAMYYVKRLGGEGYHFFTGAFDRETV